MSKRVALGAENRTSASPCTSRTRTSVRATPSGEPATAQTGNASGWAWSPQRTLALASLVLLVGAIPVFRAMVNHDVAWILYMADRVLGGATLYTDIIEINPPLIVWLNVPIAALAHLLATSSILVFRIVVLALIAGSLALSATVIASIDAPDGVDGAVIVLVACAALVVFPGYDFGQREHLMLILVLPYVLLASARARGQTPGPALALTIGVAAGVGLALKPYFLTVWIGLVVYTWVTERRLPWRRVEVVVSASVAVLYLLTVVLFTPQYFGVIRTFAPLYRSFDNHSFFSVVRMMRPAIAAVLVWVVLRRFWGWRPVGDVLAVAVIALVCSAVLQRKGWSYHRYPAQAATLLLVTSLALYPLRRLTRRPRAHPLLVAGTIIAFISRGALTSWYQDPLRPRTLVNTLAPVVRYYAKGGSIVVLSERIFPGFPLVNYTGTTWASRYCCQWFVQAMYPEVFARRQGQVPHPGDATPLEDSLRRSVVDDLLRYRPRLIIASRGPVVDYLSYYAHDVRFPRLLANYRRLGHSGEYDLWVLRDSTVAQ